MKGETWIYKCKVEKCKRGFPSEGNMRSHLRSEHNFREKRILKCGFLGCEFVSPDGIEYRRHLYRVHGIRRIKNVR